MPMMLLVFWRKNPVEWMISSTSPGVRVREVRRRRIPGEERGRDLS